MKTFLGCLLAAFVFAVVAAAMLFGWSREQENRRLWETCDALKAEIAQLGAERTAERAALKSMTDEKESLARNLSVAMNSLDQAKARQTALQNEKRRVDAELERERRLAREKAEAEAKAAATRAAEAERAARAEAERLRAETPFADVGTLKQLLDLTDKAPRRSAD